MWRYRLRPRIWPRAPENQIVVNTSFPATQPSTASLFRRKNGPTASNEKPGAKTTTVGELHKRSLPRFTLETFTEYLVRFIVADDQVSDIFTYMLLHKSLQDSDVPHRDRLREDGLTA
jgi:hypothetical protein